jgi:hypothetical protein
MIRENIMIVIMVMQESGSARGGQEAERAKS